MLENLIFHYKRGRHNDIPLCCIIWFQLRSWSRWPVLVGDGWRYKLWVRYVANRDINYIRCAVCAVRKQVNNVHRCTERGCDSRWY